MGDENNPLQCQKLCAAADKCKSFYYRPEGENGELGKCIFSDQSTLQTTRIDSTINGKYHFAGLESCSSDESFCEFFNIPLK